MEAGIDEITNMLQRVRTLAVQAANGINTAEDRTALDNEANELGAEITRIADKTTYAGKTILCGDGSANSIYGNPTATTDAGTIEFQVGANSGDKISLTVQSFTLEQLAQAANKVSNGVSTVLQKAGGSNIRGFNLTTAADASKTIAAIDVVLQVADSQRATLGAIQNRLTSSINVQSAVATNESDARSRIRDTDFAEESAKLSQQSIIQQAATSMLMQANTRPQIGLSLIG